ncbi:MAG: UDP-3-O-[3-hydroxymyristoyl] N-acetylglucosamine deacetylase [Bacteroidaceae bacterium]|nr:UDP-3-O-[3-hydroxymyristoyl] N-acetylglucosamine deacetylase [Bacteroidaceae bacterium]
MTQQTLKAPFTLRGKGLHTGLDLTATFQPAAAGHGYKIQRTDLPGQPVIDVVAENVVDTSRGTVVANGDARCSTIEHCMAALYALGVDNCLIQTDGPEVPILDGSARYVVEAINRVGLQAQDAERREFVVTEDITFTDEENGCTLTLSPADGFSIDATIAFQSQFIESQRAVLESLDSFADEISAARTFVFVREIMPLLQLGLIKGGDLDNAIVIYEHEVSQQVLDGLADALGVAHRDATRLGYLNTRPLTWPNEPARHKLLDIIGDMALIGCRLRGRITALRPGHTVNNKFARLVRSKAF